MNSAIFQNVAAKICHGCVIFLRNGKNFSIFKKKSAYARQQKCPGTLQDH